MCSLPSTVTTSTASQNMQYLLGHDHHALSFHHQPLVRSKSIGNNHTLTLPNYKPPSRRLSSGSACEACRRRKTKCDGGQPCAYCASNGIECLHRNTRRKAANNTSSSLMISTGNRSPPDYMRPIAVTCAPYSRPGSSSGYAYDRRILSKQTSCPSLIVTTHWPPSSPPKSNLSHDSLKDDKKQQYHQQSSALSTSNCWSTSSSDYYGRGKEEMPSMMDQLSCRTFSTVVYPLSAAAASNTKPELASPLSRTCSSSSSNTGH